MMKFKVDGKAVNIHQFLAEQEVREIIAKEERFAEKREKNRVSRKKKSPKK